MTHWNKECGKISSIDKCWHKCDRKFTEKHTDKSKTVYTRLLQFGVIVNRRIFLFMFSRLKSQIESENWFRPSNGNTEKQYYLVRTTNVCFGSKGRFRIKDPVNIFINLRVTVLEGIWMFLKFMKWFLTNIIR